MAEWHDMKGAPDNRDILLYNPMVGVFQSRMNKDGAFPLYLWGGVHGTWYPVPACWTDLPEPPK